MREVSGIALFVLAVGFTAAGTLRLVGQGNTSKVVSVVWCVLTALLWGAWYASR